MYSRSAKYYDTIYSFVDYRAAAAKLVERVRKENPGASSLLDVGCGTAKHCSYLDAEFEQIEGIDISPQLLEIARARLPDRAFHEGDMVNFSLDRQFDVVSCLFSVIGAAETLERMRGAIRNMAMHLRPGGLLLVEPWFSPETYWTGHVTSNHVDEKALKITWMYIAKKEALVSVLDINYLVGTPTGIEHFTEQHRLGLFTNEEYIEAFAAAGLQASYDAAGFVGRGLFTARRSTDA